ncbi:MAG: nucleotide-binding protein, partial [Planctomycetota bacterium]
MEFKDYVQVLTRRWPIAFIVFMITAAALIGVFTVRNVPVYSASAKVGIKLPSPPKPLQDLDLKEFYSAGYGYFTQEALIKSRQVYEYAAAVYLHFQDKGEDPKRADDALLEDLREAEFLDEKYELIRSRKVKDTAAVLRGAVTSGQASDRIQLIDVRAVSGSGDDAILRVNAFGVGAEIYSRKLSTDNLVQARDALLKRIDVIENEEMRGLQKARPVNEHDVNARLRHSEDLRSDITKHRGKLESVRSQRGKLRKRQTILHGQQHLEHTPVPRLYEDSLSSPLLDSLRRDIAQARTEMTVNIALRWRPSHPRYQELKRRITELQREALIELDRLRSAEISRMTDEDAVLEVEEVQEELLLSRKLMDLERQEIILRYDQPRLDEYRRLRDERDRLKIAHERLATTAELQQPFFVLEERAEAGFTVAAASSWTTKIVMWLVIALILGIGAAFAVEYWDTNLYTDYDVRRHLNMTCIGLIESQKRGDSPLLPYVAARSLLSERFNAAATILRTYLIEREFKTVAVCSAIKGEGKTTVTVNLAVAMARKGLRVVLVDSDLRLSKTHEIFGVANNRGLSSYLSQQEEGRE